MKNYIKKYLMPAGFALLLAGGSAFGQVGVSVNVPGVSVNVGGAPAVAPDSYVYYPAYGVYYNTHRHVYAYPEGSTWVTRPAPAVPLDVLRASPSVPMEFHDSPALHHSTVMHQYPRDWKPGRR
jgi:hypothetical protein